MVKKELVREVRERVKKRVEKETWVKKEVIEAAVDEVFKVIVERVKEGDEVYIRGFGRFFPKKRKARFGYDLKRSKKIPIPERVVFAFRPSKKIHVIKEE
jgi:DNA-binding protein HU-beta